MGNSPNRLINIECKDILLREYRIEDLDSFCAITRQPEIIEFLPGWNVPNEQRLDWLTNYEIIQNNEFLQTVSEGSSIEDRRLRLGIVLKETGEFIGWCCTGMKDELPYPNREIMYAISNKYTNKGYTTQAAQGIINYLFENTNVELLNAIALIRNLPSNRVIQKCGFDFHNTLEILNEKYNYYTLSKSKWDNRN